MSAMVKRHPRDNDTYAMRREAMVEEQLARRGITDPQVLTIMRSMPRHLFTDENFWGRAYEDHPLPIGQGQTISQPFMVALMTQTLKVQDDDRVLEIGTGSGYQAAILSHLVKKVFTIERHGALAKRAREAFDQLNIHNIAIRIGDGTIGWSEYAPYDGIVVTAGSPDVPQPLLDQLSKDGGRLVIPVGDRGFQQLKVITRTGDNWAATEDVGCTFVPLVGKHGWSEGEK
ncbi:protein-L-isoaspartate(D-aspartate) O-methyltransferase [Gemmatimonadota bacterium]